MFVSGFVNDTFPGALGSSGPGALVMEVSPDDGSILWSRVFGGMGSIGAQARVIQATDTNLYIGIDASGSGTLELGAAGNVGLSRIGKSFVVQLSRTDGAALVAWQAPTSVDAAVDSLEVSDRGVLVGWVDYRNDAGSRRDSSARATLLSLALANPSEVANVPGPNMQLAGAFTRGSDTVVVGSTARNLDDTYLTGWMTGTDLFIRGIDSMSRERWTKYDGEGIGFESAVMGQRGASLLIAGSHTRGFVFEGVQFPEGSRGMGYLIELTLP